MPLGRWFGKSRAIRFRLSGRPGLNARQFNEWITYDAVEPFGESRSELRNGILCSLIANSKRDSKAKPDPFTPHDFMMFSDRPEERSLSEKEIEQELDRIFGT